MKEELVQEEFKEPDEEAPDWGRPKSPEASRRPPPTETPELNEALADLVPPRPEVAVSAAPVKMAPEETHEQVKLDMQLTVERLHASVEEREREVFNLQRSQGKLRAENQELRDEMGKVMKETASCACSNKSCNLW